MEMLFILIQYIVPFYDFFIIYVCLFIYYFKTGDVSIFLINTRFGNRAAKPAISYIV